ncbi:MAG: endoglucanase [Suilimivivens sp.]
MKQIKYKYKNLPIPGGGYVTGFLFHPKQKDILYIRTDIGGTYRYSYEENKWMCLTESVDMFDLSETYPVALAVNEKKPGRLLIASGVNGREGKTVNGKLSISEDGGKSFIHKELPCYVHGNMNGRGTGVRLITDPVDEKGIYFASQKDGLLYSDDFGDTWKKLVTGGETYMTLVWCSPEGNTVVAGTAGVVTGSDQMRGHSLYISYDRGIHFEPMLMPENIVVKGSKWSGYVAHRIDFDGRYLYVTLVNTGERSYVTEMGYSCDSGDSLGGRIIRYEFGDDGKVSTYKDITPTCLYNGQGAYSVNRDSVYPFGFGGISSCKARPGLLAASTICKDDGDMMFVSFDYGENWEPALYDLVVGKIQFETSYMRPEYNGGHNLIHWLSDVKINPFNPDEVWFNSGTGVFRSLNFTSKDRSFSDCCRGIEETVHLNVYSPVDGPVKALDIVGDLGGFAFTDLDQACSNSFSDKEGNRYITCINADFSDIHPETVVVTPRGNWKGKTKGGLILSKDYGLTFERIPLPFGISDYLDERFHEIECPNVNSGWVSLSADAKTIVYCVAEGIDLFMKGIIVSHDQGQTFQKVKIYDCKGREISDSDLRMKVFSDRVNSELFYGFCDDFAIYISKDEGNTFYPAETERMPKGEMLFGLIDCANKTEIRGEAGKEGVFYLAAASFGLWKLFFDGEKGRVKGRQLTKDGEQVFRMGLGLLHQDMDYRKDDKALYICGVIQDIYGFFRSFDDGATWEKINDESQKFGDINSIDGDSREVGRFFIATGSFGVKYGEPFRE